MAQSTSMVLGWPLFALGALSTAAGLMMSSYWPLALGLVAMAYGAFRWTESW